MSDKEIWVLKKHEELIPVDQLEGLNQRKMITHWT